ncbi:helix-turn-helix domain-containing protein [Nocardioides sp. NPDC047086]|uniref:PucR family transcriptional regulator n=1 Tax=Nocardioides sp. NPDC047086 TaxID=3154810 RepID=UPI0033D0775F
MTTDALPTEVAAWLPSFVADELRPEMIDGWVTRTSGAIRRELPELASEPDFVAFLNDAVKEHWLAFLAAFVQPDFQAHLPRAGSRMAREVADRQLPLELLIKIYRAAQQESWRYVTGVVNALPTDQIDHAALLIFLWGRASSWIDAAITDSTEIFHAENSRHTKGVAAQRYEVVKAVLAGESTDARRTSAALGGYPMSVRHTALILETADAYAIDELDRIVREVANRLGGSNPLVVHPGGRRLWAWIGTRDQPDLGSLDDLRPALEAIRAVMYAGAPAPGQEGFVSSHDDARRTLRISASGGRPAPVMRYDRVELLALLGCSAEVDRFVDRVLGPLGSPDEPTARIRETVLAFLSHSGNVEDAAEELCVHRNTVRYRLGRAEELLARPVAKSGDELRLAIQHRALFHATEGQD